MANILYIHQYFKTPDQPGGTRSYWFSKKLIERGHSVTMVSARESQNSLIVKEQIEGINVIYIRNAYSNEMGVLRRFFSFVRFMILSTYVCLKQKNIDLIYATSTPLTVGFPAIVCKIVRRIPYIFEVRDLWPEVPIQMGGLNNPVLQRIAIGFEKLIYKKANHIVALSPGMQDGVIQRGTPKEKVSMIPNMSKIDKFWKRDRDIEIAKRFNIDLNKFNVIHFGTMGIANGLEYIIDAAEILKNEKNQSINFILLGKGGVKPRLMELSKDKGLNNIQFIDAQPMEIVSEIVNLCDVSLVPFKNIPILQTNSPNKLFDSLSAGIPIIVNSAGWTKVLVEDNKCGTFVNPENPSELVRILKQWLQSPVKLKEMGYSARTLAVNEYDKSILAEKFITIIENSIH